MFNSFTVNVNFKIAETILFTHEMRFYGMLCPIFTHTEDILLSMWLS